MSVDENPTPRQRLSINTFRLTCHSARSSHVEKDSHLMGQSTKWLGDEQDSTNSGSSKMFSANCRGSDLVFLNIWHYYILVNKCVKFAFLRAVSLLRMAVYKHGWW